MKPTDISTYRNKPDPRCVCEVNGVTWYCYSAKYKDPDGKTMYFRFWATSSQDADTRMAALRRTAQVDGQILTVKDLL